MIVHIISFQVNAVYCGVAVDVFDKNVPPNTRITIGDLTFSDKPRADRPLAKLQLATLVDDEQWCAVCLLAQKAESVVDDIREVLR